MSRERSSLQYAEILIAIIKEIETRKIVTVYMWCTRRNINEEYPKNHKNITNGKTKKLVTIKVATLGSPDVFFPEDVKRHLEIFSILIQNMSRLDKNR